MWRALSRWRPAFKASSANQSEYGTQCAVPVAKPFWTRTRPHQSQGVRAHSESKELISLSPI